MSVLTLDRCLSELAAERERLAAAHPHTSARWQGGGSSFEVYWRSWAALNRWIETQLSRKMVN